MSKHPRILILSASAGTGHLRAAEALEKVARADERVADVLHLDCLKHTNRVFRDFYSKAYIETAKKAPALWGWAFDETNHPWRRARGRLLMQRANSLSLIRKLKIFKPDICICTHFMPADIISHLIKHDHLDTQLHIVVTDFYVHATWCVSHFTNYYVAKEECRVQLSMLGFPEERVVVSGIPIDPAFSTTRPAAELKKEYGLEPDLPTIILSAGALGIMAATDIIDMLQSINTPCQIVVIAGRNETLQEDMQAYADASPDHHIRFHILGYTSDMPDWLTMADLFIGKPGGLTTSECFAMGLPMVIWNPIPGQELYNSAYILEENAGIAPNAATTLGFKIDQLLQNPEKMQNMAAASKSLSHSDAAFTIIERLLSLDDPGVIKVSRKAK